MRHLLPLITLLAFACAPGSPGSSANPPVSDHSDGPDCGVAELDAGSVADVAVGASAVLRVPVEDSADVDETILSASVTGADADAFMVESTFPMDVPAGSPVVLEVLFTPAHAGSSNATLALQTAGMGESDVPITANGYDP